MNDSSQIRITNIRLLNLRTVEHVGDLEPAWNVGGDNAFQHRRRFDRRDRDRRRRSAASDRAVRRRCCRPCANCSSARIPSTPNSTRHRLRYYAPVLPYRGAAGVDIALWDIDRQGLRPAALQAVGRRTRARCRPMPAWCCSRRWRSGWSWRTRLADEGWQAIKLRIHYATMAEDIALVEAVREAVGDRMAIMVDANQAQSSGTGSRVCSGIIAGRWRRPRRWISWTVSGSRSRCRATPLPAGHDQQPGVRCRWPAARTTPASTNCARWLEENVYGVLQPESMVLGGITTLRKVGVLAEVFGKAGRTASRRPRSGHDRPSAPDGLLAHSHPIWRCSTIRRSADYRHGFSIFAEPPVVDAEGFVQVPQKPGLGVEIDPDLIGIDDRNLPQMATRCNNRIPAARSLVNLLQIRRIGLPMRE